jgi:hypothetical protein
MTHPTLPPWGIVAPPGKDARLDRSKKHKE